MHNTFGCSHRAPSVRPQIYRQVCLFRIFKHKTSLYRKNSFQCLDVGLEIHWKWNTDITQLFKVYKMDQLRSYCWSRIFWVNKTSVTLIMLLTAQTDKLIDKYKEACHDRHCFGFRNNKNFERNSSTQFQPGSVQAAYLQRTAGYSSVDTAHNTDCSWK